VFALRLVLLPLRRHFAVALASSTRLSACAFCAITRLTVLMSALYIVLLLISLHTDSSLLVCMGFNASVYPYICALRHVLIFALQLVFLQLRRHFAVALALFTCLSVRAFRPITRLAVAAFALYVILMLITLHADLSLLVHMEFNTSFCPYICALRHAFVLTFAPQLVCLP